MSIYDTIVIGLGAMGSATLFQLAQRGVRVLGIDQYHPPHTLGSTHGETRITRLAVGEGAAYVPLVRRSHEIWREIEAQTGVTLMHETGGYIIGPKESQVQFHGQQDFVRKSTQLAQQYDIPHVLQSAAQVRERLPTLVLEDHCHAFYEPTGGVVNPELAVEIQLKLAQQHGATVQAGERVIDY